MIQETECGRKPGTERVVVIYLLFLWVWMWVVCACVHMWVHMPVGAEEVGCPDLPLSALFPWDRVSLDLEWGWWLPSSSSPPVSAPDLTLDVLGAHLPFYMGPGDLNSCWHCKCSYPPRYLSHSRSWNRLFNQDECAHNWFSIYNQTKSFLK